MARKGTWSLLRAPQALVPRRHTRPSLSYCLCWGGEPLCHRDITSFQESLTQLGASGRTTHFLQPGRGGAVPHPRQSWACSFITVHRDSRGGQLCKKTHRLVPAVPTPTGTPVPWKRGPQWNVTPGLELKCSIPGRGSMFSFVGHLQLLVKEKHCDRGIRTD